MSGWINVKLILSFPTCFSHKGKSKISLHYHIWAINKSFSIASCVLHNLKGICIFQSNKYFNGKLHNAQRQTLYTSNIVNRVTSLKFAVCGDSLHLVEVGVLTPHALVDPRLQVVWLVSEGFDPQSEVKSRNGHLRNRQQIGSTGTRSQCKP